MPDSPPPKPYRADAAPIALDCPNCGGPLSLHTFTTVHHVVCAYCGSQLAPDDHGGLALVRRMQRKRFDAVLPLYARGTLDGVPYEIVGIVRRSCDVEGATYYWQEFLLFNPYEGFRWLIHSESDGSWSLGEPLDGAVTPTGISWEDSRTVTYAGTRYKHFQSVVARTVYVEGEFPWQVRVGDEATMHDFVAPPFGLSIEETVLDGGYDLAFTRTRYLDPDYVWFAFEREGMPPLVSGVPPLMPNPDAATARWTTRAAALFLVLWAAAAAWYVQGRDTRTILRRVQTKLDRVAGRDKDATGKAVVFEPIRETIDLSSYDRPIPLAFRFTARTLSNSWAFAEVLLVDEAASEAIGFSVEVDEWHGYTDGESWKEGTQERTVVLPAVEPKRYTLQIMPQGQRRRDGSSQITQVSYALVADPILHRYLWTPLPLILLPTLWAFYRKQRFEIVRWRESDHPIAS